MHQHRSNPTTFRFRVRRTLGPPNAAPRDQIGAHSALHALKSAQAVLQETHPPQPPKQAALLHCRRRRLVFLVAHPGSTGTAGDHPPLYDWPPQQGWRRCRAPLYLIRAALVRLSRRQAHPHVAGLSLRDMDVPSMPDSLYLFETWQPVECLLTSTNE